MPAWCTAQSANLTEPMCFVPEYAIRFTPQPVVVDSMLKLSPEIRSDGNIGLGMLKNPMCICREKLGKTSGASQHISCFI